MIKHLLTLLSVLLTMAFATGQSFDFYAQFGPIASQIDGDRAGGYNKLGLCGGLGIARSFDPQWTGKLELNFTQKGKGKYNEDGTSYIIKLNYVELPILADYHIIDKLHIESGFSLGYLISYGFYEDGVYEDEDPKYPPYYYDIDWLLGGSYMISEQWRINLRFAYSIFAMRDIVKDDMPTDNFWENTGGQYNRSLCVSMQYWFMSNSR